MTAIALFGTSADPPTTGHQAILRWLSDRYDWVAVWASDNPYKEHQTPLECRMAMLHLAIADIDTQRNNISLNRELSSARTIETVECARAQWGAAVDLTLVVGADLVPQLPRWYRAKDLFCEVSLLIVPRPGYVLTPEALQALTRSGGRYEIANFEPPDVSSTAYRQARDREAAIPSVEDYIHQQQLYAS
ncbi:MAG: nicotinate-nucleotide adenylyltransferase [Spirulinaceae cyanobacterium RM2_2_10]|nr:nicotinate-nucleotide adenylyltransferase [Spirulinaceae cyanobacterium SM2_1_0]NJO19705.1 nicotinate-nucleotide adenylyltransferase [Spirulinaceae cyanobacterium RM2_2_10]